MNSIERTRLEFIYEQKLLPRIVLVLVGTLVVILSFFKILMEIK